VSGWIELPGDVLPEDWFGPLPSTLVAFGMAGVVLIAAAMVALRSAWLAASRARTVSRAMNAGPFRAGPVILHGRAESVDSDESPLATVTVTQSGSEQRAKNGWRHTWREVERKTSARPFVLVLANGDRVRVETSAESARLHAPLDRIEIRTSRRRDRSASVMPGADLYVTGTLEPSVDANAAGRDYRSAAESFALRGSPRDPMVIATASPVARLVRRARVFSAVAAALLVVVVALHATVLARFDRLVVAGHVETVALTWPTVNTGSSAWARARFPVRQYVANGVLRDSHGVMHSMRGEVNAATYNVVFRACDESVRQNDDSLALMPFLVARGASQFHLAGTRNGLSATALWIVIGSVVASLLAYRVARRAMVDWFDGKRLDESGSGRL
jgi:hypothetical protein